MLYVEKITVPGRGGSRISPEWVGEASGSEGGPTLLGPKCLARNCFQGPLARYMGPWTCFRGPWPISEALWPASKPLSNYGAPSRGLYHCQGVSVTAEETPIVVEGVSITAEGVPSLPRAETAPLASGQGFFNRKSKQTKNNRGQNHSSGPQKEARGPEKQLRGPISRPRAPRETGHVAPGGQLGGPRSRLDLLLLNSVYATGWV